MIFSTEWAAESALKHYKVEESKCKWCPLCQSTKVDFRDKAEIDKLIERRSREQCRLLFIGRDWIEKGGPFAVDTLRVLESKGLNAHLTVVGCKIPTGVMKHLAGKMTDFPILHKDKNQVMQNFRSFLRLRIFFFYQLKANVRHGIAKRMLMVCQP